MEKRFKWCLVVIRFTSIVHQQLPTTCITTRKLAASKYRATHMHVNSRHNHDTIRTHRLTLAISHTRSQSTFLAYRLPLRYYTNELLVRNNTSTWHVQATCTYYLHFITNNIYLLSTRRNTWLQPCAYYLHVTTTCTYYLHVHNHSTRDTARLQHNAY